VALRLAGYSFDSASTIAELQHWLWIGFIRVLVSGIFVQLLIEQLASADCLRGDSHPHSPYVDWVGKKSAEAKSRRGALAPSFVRSCREAPPQTSNPFYSNKLRAATKLRQTPQKRIINVEGWGSFTELPKLNLTYRASLGAEEGGSDVHSQSLFTRCSLLLSCRIE
jgi:hypothetical protein